MGWDNALGPWSCSCAVSSRAVGEMRVRFHHCCFISNVVVGLYWNVLEGRMIYEDDVNDLLL